MKNSLAVAVLGAIAVFRLMITQAPFLKRLSCLGSRLFCCSDGDYSRKNSSPAASRCALHFLIVTYSNAVEPPISGQILATADPFVRAV
jgi:hypothetical protein